MTRKLSKLLLAPNAFKGSLNSAEVADAMREGILRVDKDIDYLLCPMADGGEGTVEILVNATGGKYISAEVHSPIKKTIPARYGILGDGETVVIEMSAASGIKLLTETEKNPLQTTTLGTGELIKDALGRGYRKLIVGLGDSATVDAGLGALYVLGCRYYDKEGKELSPQPSALTNLARIDDAQLDRRLLESEITIACDVTNPLGGRNGAAHTFAAQKGASAKDIETLEAFLIKFAEVVSPGLDYNISSVRYGGAAGGMAAGLMAICGGKPVSGAEIMIDYYQLNEKITACDLVFTGEGEINHQTKEGKAPYQIAQLAKKHNIPTIAIVGKIGESAYENYHHGMTAIFSIADGNSDLKYLMNNAVKLITETTESILRTMLCGGNL